MSCQVSLNINMGPFVFSLRCAQKGLLKLVSYNIYNDNKLFHYFVNRKNVSNSIDSIYTFIDVGKSSLPAVPTVQYPILTALMASGAIPCLLNFTASRSKIFVDPSDSFQLRQVRTQLSSLNAFAPFLLKRRAILLHASTIIYKDQAFVFIGGSGVGKSTIIKKLKEKGAHVLADDCTLLYSSKSAIYAYPTWKLSRESTPIASHIVKNNCHFVASAIFFLAQGKFAIQMLGLAPALGRTYRNTLLYLAQHNITKMDFMDTVSHIYRIIPFYELSYDLSDNLITLLENHIDKPIIMCNNYINQRNNKEGTL